MAGLVALWFLNRLRHYYVQLREKEEKEEKMRMYFETAQRKASDSIMARRRLRGTNRLEAQVELNTCQADAHAQKDSLLGSDANQTDPADSAAVLCAIRSAASDESSSLIISSLHTSEISDAGSAGFSGSSVDLEDSWYEGMHSMQPRRSTFEMISMEEGRGMDVEVKPVYNESNNRSDSSSESGSSSGGESMIDSCATPLHS